MGQAVEERAGEPLGAESLGPFVEGQIAGDQRRASLVFLGDQLEEEFRPGLGQGNKAQFVDDQQFDFRHLLLDARAERRSSRASISSLTRAAAVVKLTVIPRPFRWTKSADDILATIKRFCLRTLDTAQRQHKLIKTSESGH